MVLGLFENEGDVRPLLSSPPTGFLQRLGAVAAACFFAATPSLAQISISTGDQVVIAAPVSAGAAGADTLRNVQVLVSPPSAFGITLSPSLGPAAISPGNTEFFQVSYSVSQGASLGAASVGVGVAMTNSGVTPAPASVSIQVPFSVTAGIPLGPDVTPPQTTISYSSATFTDKQGNLYIPKGAAIQFQAADPSVPGAATSGVAETDYLVDAVFIDTNTTPMNQYTGPIHLCEGSHTLYYASIDRAGNIEAVKTVVVRVDGTPPATSFLVAGTSAAAGGALVYDVSAVFSLTAVDPPLKSSASVAGSSVAATRFYIDVSPSQCGSTASNPAALPGTCANPQYLFPFSLSIGTHTLYWYSTDNVGNAEVVKSTGVTVRFLDNTPPVTTLAPTGPRFVDASGNLYLSALTAIGFSAVDLSSGGIPASGVNHTEFRVDSPSGTFQVFAGTFTLAEGPHQLDFRSVDNAGNVEVFRSSMVLVDATPPVTTLQVLGSSETDTLGNLYFSSATPVALSTADPVSNGVASGVDAILYVVDADPASPACEAVAVDTTQPAGTCANEIYQGPFYLSTGTHVVYYLSIDNVDNQEVPNVATVTVTFPNGPSPAVWSTFFHDPQHTGRITGTGSPIPVSSWTASVGTILSQAISGPDGSVYMVGGGALYAINKNGSIRWTLPGGLPAGPPSLSASGVLYVGGSVPNDPPFNEQLQAVYPDGTVKWRLQIPGVYSGGAGFGQTAIGPTGTVYSINSQDNNLYAVTPDGTVLWTFSLNPAFADSNGPAIGADGTIYAAATNPGTLFAVNPDGTQKWSVTTAGYYVNGNAPTVRPDGSILIGSNSYLQAFSPTGVLLWTFNAKSLDFFSNRVSASAIGKDGTIYICDTFSKIIALDPNGSVKWTFDAASDRFNGPASPVVDGQGSVYIPSFSNTQAPYYGSVFALNSDGTLKWKLPMSDNLKAISMNEDGTIFVGGNALYTIEATPAASPDGVVSLLSGAAGISIVMDSTAAPNVSIALATAASRGLQLASSVYEITHSTFTPYAQLVFRFDPSVVRDTTTLALFRYDGVGWSSAPATGIISQSVFRSSVTASIAFASLWALFVRAPDLLPPRTVLDVGQPQFGSTPTFITSATALSFTAVDDFISVGDGKGAGVAQTFFGIDAPPTAQYAAPFKLAFEGLHSIQFFSVDLAGNKEMIHISTIAVDNTPPVTQFSVNGASTPASGAISAPAGSTFTLTAQDPSVNGTASGVRTTLLSINGSSFAASTQAFSLANGNYGLTFYSVDNVGNQEAANTLQVQVGPPPPPNPQSRPVFEYSFKFGGTGTGNGLLSSTLNSIAADRNGNIYVADAGNGVIQKFDRNGNFLLQWGSSGSGPGQFGGGYPTGMRVATDASGNVWVTDSFNSRVEEFTPNGQYLGQINTGNYVSPVGAISDASGNVYVYGSYGSTGKIIKFSASGVFITSWTVDGYPPSVGTGITLDSRGNVYAVAWLQSIVKKYDPNGNFLLQWGGTGGGNGLMSAPEGIATDIFDNVYVADTNNNQIQVFTSTGGFITQFGQVAKTPAGILHGPVDVAVDFLTGNVFTPDYLESTVKVYAVDVTTPAPPTVDSPASGSYVSATKPIFTGTAEWTSRVRVLEGSNILVDTAVSTATGRYNAAATTSLSVGAHNLQLVQLDPAGHVSSGTAMTVNVVPLPSLAFSPMAPVSFYNSSVSPSILMDATYTPILVPGDFNGDGKQDVVAITQDNYGFFKGDGTGNLTLTSKSLSFTLTSAYSDAVAYDMNRDGKLDIVAVNPGAVSVLLGNGDGTFGAPIGTSLGSFATHRIAVADLNGDGIPDVVAAGYYDSGLYGAPGVVVLLGNGDGTFQAPVVLPTPPLYPDGVKIADMDGDGKLDIVAGNAIYFGDGQGHFPSSTTLRSPLPASGSVSEVVAADLNGDGRKDVLLEVGSALYTFINLGSRNFVWLNTGDTASGNLALAAADLAQRGFTDLVGMIPIISQDPDFFVVNLGQGDGTESTATRFNSAYTLSGNPVQYPRPVLVDLNGDGRPDVVIPMPNPSFSNRAVMQAFLNTTPTQNVVPPAAVTLSAAALASGGISLQWIAPGNDGYVGQAASYDVRYATTPIPTVDQFLASNAVAGAPAPLPAGSSQTFIVSGLNGGSTYYFALRTTNTGGSISNLSNSPGVVNLYLAQSTTTVGGQPEIAFTDANIQTGIALISSGSPTGALVLASAAAQNIFFISNVYDLQPEGYVFSPPATLTFRYSTATLAGLGMLEADAAVYHFDSTLGWVKVAGQTQDTTNHLFTVPIGSIASIYALLGIIRDTTPPVTTLGLSGPQFTNTAGQLFIASGTLVGFTAVDPSSGSVRPSGVAKTEYAVDQASGPFVLFISSFTLAEGLHTLYFWSVDNAGNTETTKSTMVRVDATPPATRMTLSASGFIDASSRTYIIGATSIGFAAQDPVSSNVASGVALIEFRVDAASSAAFGTFLSTFTLAEGMHSIDFRSRDNVGNVEIFHSSAVYADATPPVSAVGISSPQYVASDGTVYVTPATPVTVAAADPPLASISTAAAIPGSGVNHLEVAADTTTFSLYVSALVFAEGRHTLLYRSIDNAGNVEAARAVSLRSDNTPPITQALLSTPAFVDSSSRAYISGMDFIAFSATDPTVNGTASGVALTQFRVDAGTPTAPFSTFVSSFTLSQGAHAVDYRSVDNVGNTEAARTLSVVVDTAPPVSAIAFGNPFFSAADGSLYVTPGTPVTLSAADPAVSSGLPGSGVGRILVSVDGAPFAAYASTLTFAEGIHLIQFYGVDNVGNAEAPHSVTVKADNTPPITTLAPSGAFYGYGLQNFAPASFTYALNARDPAANGVASGARQTTYRVNGGAFTVYLTTFTLSEGLERVDYQSVDNVGNTELLRNATVYVDATPPITALAVGAPSFNLGGSRPVVVATSTLLDLSAQDPVVNGVASGVKQTFLSIGGSTFSAYASPFTLSAPDGIKTVNFYSIDNVANLEITRSTTVALDATPPVTSLLVIGGRQFQAPPGLGLPNPAIYASSGTTLGFTAADPVSGGVAAGLAFTQYQDCGGGAIPCPTAFKTFTSSFTLAEGAHALGYQSQDNVQNLEALRSTTVLVDATPPVSSATIGSPKFVAADGTIYVTPASPVTFSAADPALPPGGSGAVPGSGVNYIEVSVDGGAFAPYSSALTFAEGRHAVLFRAVDNVGNVEAAHTLALQSDATPPITALAVSSPSFSQGAGQPAFVSAATLLTFSAADPVINSVASGVALTRYRINGGVFVQSPLAFNLAGSDGLYAIDYQSQDNVGNLEVLRSTLVLLDQTPPATTVHVGVPSFTAADGTIYVTPATPITFSAVDPSSGGVASGVNHLEVAIDGGAFAIYAATITFAEGRYTISYRAVDNVGNIETSHTLALQSDNTPPVTAFVSNGTFFTIQAAEGTRNYAPAQFTYALSAQDPVVNNVASGVASTTYRMGQVTGFSSGSPQYAAGPFQTYASAFNLAEGIRRVDFQSRDNVGNVELLKSATVFVDATPPVTTLTIGSPQAALAGTVYVSTATPLSLSAQDPVIQEVASGVKQISVSPNGAAYSAYAAPFSLSGPDGPKTVSFYALDNVGNTEVAKSSGVVLDQTPPAVTISSPSAGQVFVAKTNTIPIGFSAKDNFDPNPRVSGVLVELQDQGAPRGGLPAVVPVTSGQNLDPLAIDDGLWQLQVTATDFVGNSTTTYGGVFQVIHDIQPPRTAATVGTPQFIVSSSTYIAAATPLSLSATDDLLIVGDMQGLGVRSTYYSVDGGSFAVYTSSFSLGADGVHVWQFYSVDVVGNIESTHTVTLETDATPPVTSLSATGGRSFPGPNAATFYASSAAFLAFVATDPVVNGVASGVALTRYQDCGSTPGCSTPFQSFTSGFYLSEGAHALSYQSRDNVQNLEVLRSTTVLIDATPPATMVTVGQPSYTSPGGTLYVSTQTPVAFSAADPALPTGQPGSGVNRIEISIDGAPFAAYGSALLLAEGAHTILYRAVDNVGNIEVSHTLAVQADATPPVSSLSIGQPQFAVSSSTVLVSSRTPFSISAVDPVVNGVASGVRQSFYRINSSSFTAYSAPFALSSLSAGVVPPDGPQSIFFYSQDNVLNAETVKAAVVSLDATAPQAAILSPSAMGSGICRVLKGVFPVLGSALDTHLASYTLDFAPGQNAISGFTLISSAAFGPSSPGFETTLVGMSSGTLGVWNASALSGWQTIRLTALDLVQNATVVTVNVYVGDPAELLLLGNHTLFNMPRGVAVDSGRDIYVADTNDNLIKEFTSTGTFLAAFGLGDGRAHSRNFDPDDNPTVSTAAVRLNKPKGVAVDAGGNIYIADTNDDRVLELSATGQVLLELGKRSVDGAGREHFKPGQNPGEFNAPSAVAVGGNGSIYVADTENRRLQVFSSTGGVALVVYMPALTPFCTGPGGAAPCSPPGNDDDSGEDGYPPGPGVGNLGRPEGIAVDLSGNIYVADPQGSRALKFDPTGKLLLTIPILGQPGSQNANSGGSGSSGSLVQSEPNGIAVSPSGDCILVSDRKFARILKFDALGNQLLVFGTQGKIPDNQAPPSGIVFQKPVGLAMDNLGNLYVADRNNDRVEEFGLPTGQPTLVVPPPVTDPNAARDVVASADGGAVSRSDGASVQVPPGALAQDLKITVSTATDQDALQISLASKKAGDKGLQVAYAPISFSPEGTQFSQAVTLVMPYTPDLLLAQGITEDQLAIDYWNPAKSDWEALPSVVDKVNHLVTAKTSHFSLYQVHSGTGSARALAAPQPAADPTFVFRDLYAFPNPAIRGKSPTIRLQVGVADSVELHIYDISGKLVHQAGLTAPPQPMDDGNGKGTQYTYDYPWDVSGVGSGVYIYSVTAKKAGQPDIRRIKKLGVVR